MLVHFDTGTRIILSEEAALDAAREGIIKKYPQLVADTVKVSASFHAATEVWTGYAEGVVATPATTPVVVDSSVFEDTAVDFQDDYYLYEEIVAGCKREAIKRLQEQELGKSFTKVTFQTHDETVGDIRRIWVTAIGII